MRESATKSPELFSHFFDFVNNNTLLKENEVFGKLNRDKIPNIFYNHLLISENNKSFSRNKCKYHKVSVTHRNKKKLLTIIYYSP